MADYGSGGRQQPPRKAPRRSIPLISNAARQLNRLPSAEEVWHYSDFLHVGHGSGCVGEKIDEVGGPVYTVVVPLMLGSFFFLVWSSEMFLLRLPGEEDVKYYYGNPVLTPLPGAAASSLQLSSHHMTTQLPSTSDHSISGHFFLDGL